MNGRAVSLIRYVMAVSVILYVPAMLSFQLGIENSNLLSQKFSGLRSLRIGLITNQTGRDQQGNRAIDILLQKGLRVTHILAPEHGFDGTIPAGKPVTNSVDQKTNIPIISIYGRGGDHTIAGKCVDPAVMQQIDALFYDIQDSGMRHYTYISTLLCALEAAAQHNKPIVVFDRPNFLGPFMEGPLVDPHLKSFISIASIPLRHGMTVGELASYFNKHVLIKTAQLHVIPMKGYNRIMEPPFLSPLSPNIASRASLYGYSFLGILGEIEPFYIGVGTPSAFQTILLPEDCHFSPGKWAAVRTIFHKYGIHSSYHTAMHRKKPYYGLKLHIPDAAKVASFSLLLELLSYFKQAGISFSYSATFDKAVGTQKVQELCKGSCPWQELIEGVNQALEQFLGQAKDSFLYTPLPEIRKMF
jgi:hypothetical protein